MWMLWLVGGVLLVSTVFVLGAVYGKQLEQKAQRAASKLKEEVRVAEKRVV